MHSTVSRDSAMPFGREAVKPERGGLPAERAPFGPASLLDGARSMQHWAATKHADDEVVDRGIAAPGAQLHDACLAGLPPADYLRLASSLKRTLAEDANHLEVLTTSLRRLVQSHAIAFALQGRIKGLCSLYSKMVRKGRNLEEIKDRLGVRIIVRSTDDCYRVLGLVHTHFAYVPGTFDDYIGAPKANGYRSLHTCVSATDHLLAEIQIRTLQMHLEAEFGRAAHWRYKQSLS